MLPFLPPGLHSPESPRTVMKSERLRKAIWIGVLVSLLVAAVCQLKVNFDGWQARPFEEIAKTVAKQDIPFPSVTVCPSGITVWSGLRRFLNEREFKDEYREKLLRSHTTMVRLKMGSLNDRLMYVDLTKKDERFTLNDCTYWSIYPKNRELCNFIQYVLTMASRKLSKEILRPLIIEKLDKNKDYVIDDWTDCQTNFICPIYRHLTDDSIITSDLVLLQVLLDIMTIEIIEGNHITNAMDMMLQELFEETLPTQQPLSTEKPVDEKGVGCIPLWEDCGFVMFKREAFQFYNSSFLTEHNDTLKIPSNLLKTFFMRGLEDFLISKFHQLKLIEALEFKRFKNLGDFVTSLASMNLNDRSKRHREYLSMPVALQTREELNSFLNYVLKEIVGEPQLSWSLVDAVDIFLVTGSAQVVGSRLFQAPPNKIFITGWSSLSEEETECATTNYRALIEKLQTSYRNPCSNPSKNCVTFCKNLGVMQKHMKNSDIHKLMRYMSHPSKFEEGSTSWTVPFCFQGTEVKDISLAMQTNNIQTMMGNSSNKHYGYKFCPHVRQRFTDIGLCTTIEYGSKTSNVNPPKGVYSTYERGIFMILDSFAYFGAMSNKVLRTQRDYLDDRLGNFDHPDTLVDLNLDEFKVVVHNKNEVPLFIGPSSQRIYLSRNLKTFTAIEYKVLFKVEHRMMEQGLEEKYSINKRKCRFDQEVDNLKLFDTYSQDNCLFECKLELSTAACGCTPWYIETNGTKPVCDLFGNKCFEHMSLKTNDELDFSRPDNPPCGCFPACRSIKYIPEVQDTENKLKGYGNENMVDVTGSSWGNIFYWENDTWVKENNKQRYLLNYIKDIFKGNMSQIFLRDELTSDVDLYDITSTMECIRHPMDCLMHYRVENTPILRMDFKDKYVRSIEVIERVPWYDKLSAIGGTLGLFLGFSILGIVDILFWMFSNVFNLIKK